MTARTGRKYKLAAPPSGALGAVQVLALLHRQGGREYLATLYFGGEAKGEYRLTARGERVRAQGPSGTVSELDAAGFSELFGRYHFADVRPSGVLTDLGPLFG
ncbi:hypothetical protein Q0M94_00970 [Deinococcus radiomollis]|uniref:hypothetical protein n=1 Tax=Deinococcus radiomollis TaxID=468916 RepID=UPI003891AD19